MIYAGLDYMRKWELLVSTHIKIQLKNALKELYSIQQQLFSPEFHQKHILHTLFDPELKNLFLQLYLSTILHEKDHDL